MDQASRDLCIAGGACVAGISLTVINGWLTLVSLLVSIAAGLHYFWKNRHVLPDELEEEESDETP